MLAFALAKSGYVIEPAFVHTPPPMVAGQDNKKPAPPILADVTQKGVFVRQSAAGPLLICRMSDALALCNEDAPEVLYTSTNTMISQLGTLLFLSVENGILQNNSLAFTLRDRAGLGSSNIRSSMCAAGRRIMAAGVTD